MSLRSNVRRWFASAPKEAAVLQETPPGPVAVCESNAWHGFMVEVLFPHAIRISVAPGEPASRLLEVVPSTVPGVIIHLTASFTRGYIDTEQELLAGLVHRGQRVLNLGAVDVRKSTLQTCSAKLGAPSSRADREGFGHERLIVKTTLNYGGHPERTLREQWGERAAAFTANVSDAITGHLGYLVTTRAQVPPTVWDDPSLIVERFIENPEGAFFRVYAAGPAGVVSMVWVDGDVKKLSTAIRRRYNYYYWTLPSGETVTLGPSNDRALRALTTTRRIAGALEMDFVGADCMIDDEDNIVVVDVNKTPYWGEPRLSPILSHLRHGFNALIGAFT